MYSEFLSNSDKLLGCSHCELGALDGSQIKGKIVLCKHSEEDSSKSSKADNLQSLGAVGAILADDTERSKINTYIAFPVTEVSSEEAEDIITYIKSSK